MAAQTLHTGEVIGSSPISATFMAEGKENLPEIHSREYNAMGKRLFEGLCRSHNLNLFQTSQLDKFMYETAGILSTDERYQKAQQVLLRTQVDPNPVIGAMESINIVYAELFSPLNKRRRKGLDRSN